MDARAVGLVVVRLGGGRHRAEDSIDPSVGLSDICAVGDAVDGDRPLATVHARTEEDAAAAAAALNAAITLGDSAPDAMPVVYERRANPAG